MGLPCDWSQIEDWINGSRDLPSADSKDMPLFSLKHNEIPVLKDYAVEPNVEFWSGFPKNYPENICKKVKTKALRHYMQKCWFKWTLSKRNAAKSALRRLKGKVPTKLTSILPESKSKNAISAIENGKYMTDALVGWIKKGFVGGPFDKPPMKNFRINPLMAAVQKNKVRPIMNLSSPKGGSFNEAIDMFDVQKLTMSSAKLFADSLVKSGRDSVFAKSDIQDAYKLIPNPVSEWKNFGFKWLGKFFFDRTLVFGSRSAPASFDCLSATIVNIVCTEENIQDKVVHRQLDDVPVVAAKGSGIAERFAAKYKEVCGKLEVPLAENCPNHEKAFGPSTYGTVLGINFDSEAMKWSISKDKENSLQLAIDDFLNKKTCSLRELQKLFGKLANIGQMFEFMKGYRFNILSLMAKFGGQENVQKIINQDVKEDLWVWKKAISSCKDGIPLTEIGESPPLRTVNYLSDAAGASFAWENGTCKNTTEDGDRGVASVGYKNGKPTSVVVLRWPQGFITKSRTRTGGWFGTKSGTLETVGLLLPFLSNPKELSGNHVVLEVDNLGVVYAWYKKHSKNDAETSLLIRCLHVLEAYVACKIHVMHVKRCSNKIAVLADNLSRNSTTTKDIWNKIKKKEISLPDGFLNSWLKNPVLNWDLPLMLCKDAKKLL